MTARSLRTRAERQDGTSPGLDKARERAGGRWWLLTAVALLTGSFAGVGTTKLASPPQLPTLQATSNQVFTSTGGTFSKQTGSAQVAPTWSLPNLRTPSTTVSLAQFRGHPVVVNFWASWCAPCRQEMPALAATARQFHGAVDFVGVNINDSRSAALAFANKTGVSYPLGFDPSGGVGQTNSVFGLPTTLFVSPQGTILGRQVGGMTQSRLKQLITQTFGVHATARATSAS